MTFSRDASLILGSLRHDDHGNENGKKAIGLDKSKQQRCIRLATSRPHEFLGERSDPFRPRSGQARDEVARGPAHIKSDEGLF